MRKLTLLAALTAMMTLAGCATVEGVGRDISGGANRVSDWIG